MANIKSQIKRNKQNEARRVRNKAYRSAMKTSAKRVRATAESGDVAATQEEVGRATRELDKAASKGVLHKRAAARRKSRLARSAAATVAG